MFKHDFAEAERLAQRGLDLRETATSPESPALVGILRTIAECRLGQNDLVGAEESLDRARRIAVDAHGEDSESVARLDQLLAEVAVAREGAEL